MPLAMKVWIYECCSVVDLNIAEKKTNRIPRLVNWRTRNSRIHYEFLMEGMFGDNGNPLKYKNIQPSLNEIAFYQLPSKSDAIPENTFQKVSNKDDDEDDDFTSKPPSHKPHNKEKGSSCKDKSPSVLHGYRKAKSTPFSSVSTPVENNVPVQELYNQPDDSANTTPPMSSKQPQDTKAGEIGVLRQDLASFKDYVTNEFKELRLFILENFKQVMDAVNKSNPQSGVPCQEDGSKSPTHVPDWSNNNSMKDGNQISTFLDKPHFDINETFRFVLEENVKDNVQENYQPAQIHIQDPLSVHEQSNDINALQNDGIQQPQSQFELLDVLLPSLDTINPKKCVVVHPEAVVHPEGVVYDTTPVPVQRTRRPDRWNSSSYSTNFGSSSGSSSTVVKIYEKKHPFVSDFIRGPFNYDLFDDYTMWLRERLLVRHMNKMHDEDRYKNKKAELAVDKDLAYDVVLYYLRKKSKYNINSLYRYTTVDCLFKSKIDEIYATYTKVGSEICVANVESDIRDYINGYRLMAAIRWNTIDNVFIPVNVEQKNHWVLAVLPIVERCIYVYDSYRAANHNSYVRDEIQKLAQLLPIYVSMEIANNSDDTQDQDTAYDVTYVEDIPQQGSGDL
ncbi:uncharacterized protein LOC125844486 [Solanum stenotomum]|uniref:uncharacterized protein LOC125844486 n=1 Tax=Solanum stenotomum TaxID=172797 RepID=UPI0020D1E774|nr:uncharacterized protein LOC125844486 [Solanum stenotomum]